MYISLNFIAKLIFEALVLTRLTGIWHVYEVALKFTLATYQLIAKQKINANFLQIFRIRLLTLECLNVCSCMLRLNLKFLLNKLSH